MGDKTQLLAFSLAARFKRPWTVMAGILVATLLNHGLASFAGQSLAHILNKAVLQTVLGVSFLAFGFWTLMPDSLEDEKKHPTLDPFLATTVLFFFAEMGDKTQFATVALGARFDSMVLVTVGTTLGMLVSDGLAVFAGEKLAEKIQMHWMRRIAAGLFFAFGAWALVEGLILIFAR
jgi:putative Ca2+/H+ antiporter (TMEM165/GDT1 family)